MRPSYLYNRDPYTGATTLLKGKMVGATAVGLKWHLSYGRNGLRRLPRDRFNIKLSSYFRDIHHKVMSPYCRINASVSLVNIGSDNGLSPIRCQAII